VGDLAKDTAVTRVDEQRFTAVLSQEWEIWGPMGGYIASVALRAAGECSPFARPATYYCQYLGVAAFDEVDVEVTTLRSARTALAQRVSISQSGKPMLEATVWSVGEVEGLEHDAVVRPDVARPQELSTIEELVIEHGLEERPTFRFWDNLEGKPLDFRTEPATAPEAPVWQGWQRFRPTATFDDPWVDACRALVLIDVQSWPAAARAHWGTEEIQRYYAPSLDLYVAFHEPCAQSDWLLCDGRGPVARDGLMGWDGRIWSDDLRLVASGAGQLLCRRLPGQ
jgi:acyl-CoA thioesterase-2